MPKPRARLRQPQTILPRARLGGKTPRTRPRPFKLRGGGRSAWCGLGLCARRSSGPGEAGLQDNPAPFPVTAWGGERCVLAALSLIIPGRP